MAKRADGPSRVSILDIAARAGVSPSTVSRVFNNPDLVQADTRAAVLSIANKSGYRPNASARTLRTQRSRVLGIVLPTLENPVFAECLQGIASATAAQSYTIMPFTTDYKVESEEEAVQRLLAFGVEGMLLVVSDADSSAALRRLRVADLPYVLIYNRHEKHPCVSVADDEAMQEIVEGLVRLGHRRIGMVCGRLSASDRAQRRRTGFQKAARQVGLDSATIIEVPFMDTAISEISAILHRHDRPTALVCSNDLIAIRAMRAAHECQLSVPQDLSITGFDGIRIGSDLAPRLSTVSQPNSKMGSEAVDWLVRSVEQGRLPNAQDNLILPYVIQWTESSAPPSPALHQ